MLNVLAIQGHPRQEVAVILSTTFPALSTALVINGLRSTGENNNEKKNNKLERESSYSWRGWSLSPPAGPICNLLKKVIMTRSVSLVLIFQLVLHNGL